MVKTLNTTTNGRQKQQQQKQLSSKQSPKQTRKAAGKTKLKLKHVLLLLCVFSFYQLFVYIPKKMEQQEQEYNNNNNINNNNNNKNNAVDTKMNMGYFLEKVPPASSSNNNNNNKKTDNNDNNNHNIPNDPGTTNQNNKESDEKEDHHAVAGLSCEKKYGGPPDDIAAEEMVYWEDIPSDSTYINPLKRNTMTMMMQQQKLSAAKQQGPKYLTFEPDEGGWNNIRMAMENVVIMAISMGRTLVMPPEQRLYLLSDNQKEQKHKFTVADFFHFESIQKEFGKQSQQNNNNDDDDKYNHSILDVITFEEFLLREAMTGKLKNKRGEVAFPPDNRTKWAEPHGQQWNQGARIERRRLNDWMLSVGRMLPWDYSKCIASFPKLPGPPGVRELNRIHELACCNTTHEKRYDKFRGRPTPVDADPEFRLEEIIAHREKLCIYDSSLQNEKVIHVTGSNQHFRMLVHFYAFIYFEDWEQDLWTKRFIRDHLRYIDEIQCAAARVIHAIRQLSSQHQLEEGTNNNNAAAPYGVYDSMHIRRGDFQYKEMRIMPHEYHEISKDILMPNNNNANATTKKKTTLFIATDERNKAVFDVFREHYHVYFLSDFKKLLKDVNTNYFGMIDQLVASKGKIFFGTYLSTFTGYINRMRGYHSQQKKSEGYEDGILDSYYFVPKRMRNVYRSYHSIEGPVWGKEFPVGWRDLNHNVRVPNT